MMSRAQYQERCPKRVNVVPVSCNSSELASQLTGKMRRFSRTKLWRIDWMSVRYDTFSSKFVKPGYARHAVRYDLILYRGCGNWLESITVIRLTR